MLNIALGDEARGTYTERPVLREAVAGRNNGTFLTVVKRGPEKLMFVLLASREEREQVCPVNIGTKASRVCSSKAEWSSDASILICGTSYNLTPSPNGASLSPSGKRWVRLITGRCPQFRRVSGVHTEVSKCNLGPVRDSTHSRRVIHTVPTSS